MRKAALLLHGDHRSAAAVAVQLLGLLLRTITMTSLIPSNLIPFLSLLPGDGPGPYSLSAQQRQAGGCRANVRDCHNQRRLDRLQPDLDAHPGEDRDGEQVGPGVDTKLRVLRWFFWGPSSTGATFVSRPHVQSHATADSGNSTPRSTPRSTPLRGCNFWIAQNATPLPRRYGCTCCSSPRSWCMCPAAWPTPNFAWSLPMS